MADGQTTPGAGALTQLANYMQGVNASQTVPAFPTIPNIPIDQAQQIVAATGQGQMTVPGATQPFVSGIALQPRMPMQPTMMPQDRPQQLEQGTTAQRSQIGQQNLANGLANIASGMSNYFAKQRYQEKVDTIKQYTDILQRGQEAKNVLANDPNNAQAKEEAAKADAELKELTTGKNAKKNLKILEKAIPNFTDPSKNEEEVGAAKAALAKTQQEAKQGVGDKTIGEKQVGQANQMLEAKGATDKPSMQGNQLQQLQRAAQMAPPNVKSDVLAQYDTLRRALAKTPTSLQMNPAFVNEMARRQKVQDEVISKLVPTMMNVQGKEAVQAMKDQVTKYDAALKAATQILGTNTRVAGQLAIATQNNQTKFLGYEYRYQQLLRFSNDPQFAGGVGGASAKIVGAIDKDIATVQKTNADRQAQIHKLEDSINFDRPTGEKDRYGRPIFAPMADDDRRKEIEQNIRDLKAQIKVDDQHVQNLESSRDKFTDLSNVSGGGATPEDIKTQAQNLGLIPPTGAAPAGGAAPPTTSAGAGGGAAAAPANVNYAPGPAPTSYDPKGGYQQWMPMVEATRQAVAPNVPSALAQAILMAENAKGDPIADPNPGVGGQGLFQLTRTNQGIYGVKNALDPQDNATGAMRMLGTSLRNYGGDIRRAIYDYAPKASKDKPNPDPGYVDRVYRAYQQIAQQQISQRGGGVGGGAGTGVSGEAQESASTGKPAAQFAGTPQAGTTITKPQAGTAAQTTTGPQAVGPHEDDTGDTSGINLGTL